MRGDPLPDTDHVVRPCGGSHVREDGSIAPTAFRLRDGEAFLSVNWIEYLARSGFDDPMREVRRILATKRHVGRTARLAEMEVGAARRTVEGETRGVSTISIVHAPEEDPTKPIDVSHSGIHGPLEDDLVVSEILARIVAAVHPAR